MLNRETLYNMYDECMYITWIENDNLIELSPACLTDESGKIIFSGTLDECNTKAYRKGYIY